AREALRGTTALMWAAAYGNPDAVRTLLAAGADPAARSAAIQRGRGPYLAPSARERIDEYLGGTGLRGAAVAFDLDDPDPNVGVDRDDTAPVDAEAAPDDGAAAAADEDAGAADAADDDGGLFNRPRPRDWGGLTALIFAAREGDEASARLLIEAGADVNQQSEFGWTALLAATQNRYYRLGAYL